MVTDREGRVVLAGQVAAGEDRNFHIDFGGKLPTAGFTLHSQIIVNGNAVGAEIRRDPIAIPPSKTP